MSATILFLPSHSRPTPAGARPLAPGPYLPKVSLHLPICNENPHLVRQTLDALAALDYPDFEVLVVDSNTSDPVLWEKAAEHCARLGARFRFFHLGRWKGGRAAALNFALAETSPRAGIVGVVDSGLIVSPDWLRAMVPRFREARVGLMRSPQERRAADKGDLRRQMPLPAEPRRRCDGLGAQASMSLARKQALQGVGGWAEGCLSADAELGLRLFRAGWHSVSVSRSFGSFPVPHDFATRRRRRFREAFGAMQILGGHAKALFSPFERDLTLPERWQLLAGTLPWIADGLRLLFLALALGWSLALIVQPHRASFPLRVFLLPSIGLLAAGLMQAPDRGPTPDGWRSRLATAGARLALSFASGEAVLTSLVRRAPAPPEACGNPGLAGGPRSARTELVLLALSWAAMIGTGAIHGVGAAEVRLWWLVLFTLSLPCLAAVALTLLAAARARSRRRAVPLADLEIAGD
jgi:hypothetical protein